MEFHSCFLIYSDSFMIHWWDIYNAFLNRLQERKFHVDLSNQVMRHLIG